MHATLAALLLAATLAAHFVAARAGWASTALPGHEFRQAQTAISAFFIDRENNFALAYPTPVLGKPWSVPLEFPLYQWAAVGVHRLTGWPLVEAGRAVALLAFYLTLPAIARVLRRLGLDGPQRWLALALVVACPLHVFYARSFLIETTALLFAWWFLAAFAETVGRPRAGWWLVAALAGAAAATVKVTTFIVFALIAAGWTVFRLRQLWRESAPGARIGRGVRGAAWSLALVVVPLAAGVAWTRFADGVKAANPAGRFLMSGAMGDFNFGFGFFDLRFKALTWTTMAGYVHDSLLPLPALGAVVVLALLPGGRWRRWALVAFAGFALAPLLFPMLYASHDYYFVATAALLLLVAGFALAGLAERAHGRWLALAAAAALVGVQAWSFSRGYLRQQIDDIAGGDDLSEQIAAITRPDDVLVVAGRDWNAALPFYAGRRALLVRGGTERDWPLVEASFARLAGEPLGALVLAGDQRRNGELLRLAAERLGFDPRAALVFPAATVFLPRSRIPEWFPGVAAYRPAEGDLLALPPLLGQWPEVQGRIVAVADLHPVQRQIFAAMRPAPVRFFSEHGAGAIRRGSDQLLNTHSTTRLWFPLAPGARRLRAVAGMYAGCWADPAHATDGIEIAVSFVRPDGTAVRVASRVLDPLAREADRGDLLLDVLLPAERDASELLVEILPGPRGGGAYDWAFLGAVTID